MKTVAEEEGNYHILTYSFINSTISFVEGFDSENFTVLECNLNSFASVKSFVAKLLEFKEEVPIDRFVCNAAVYQPSLPEPKVHSLTHSLT